MSITKTFYEEVFFVDDAAKLNDNQFDNLIMVGKKNLDCFFTPFKTKREHEVIKNVELLEFDTEDELFEYYNKLDDTLFLNYCFDFEKPCLLKFV